MTDDEHRRIEAILTFSLNLESAGDVVERNIAAFVAKHLKRGIELSPDADQEIAGRLRGRAGQPALRGLGVHDRRPARGQGADPAEGGISPPRGRRDQDLFCRAPRPSESAATQTSPLDLLRDIKRLNDHLVAGAAYPVLEAAGDLMPSRIADDGGGGRPDRADGVRESFCLPPPRSALRRPRRAS